MIAVSKKKLSSFVLRGINVHVRTFTILLYIETNADFVRCPALLGIVSTFPRIHPCTKTFHEET